MSSSNDSWTSDVKLEKLNPMKSDNELEFLKGGVNEL